MKKIIFSAFVILFVFTTNSVAQIGLNTGYSINKAAKWEITGFNENDLIAEFYPNGLSFGLDYWFRLKKYRIEFTPEINYASTSIQNNVESIDYQSNTSSFSFFANTNFYIFEIKGDCNCPTFSKPGLELEKGFFLRLSPGISYFNASIEQSNEKLESKSFAFSIGAGIGIDFGLSDFVTVTPIIMYRYYPTVKWEHISTLNTGIKEWTYPEDKSSISQIYGGIRLGVRFDYR